MKRHWLVPVLLGAALLLGGASAAGFIANLLLQLAALPVIGWSLWRLLQPGAPLSRSIRAVLALAALLAGLMLFQLAPLPPGIWTLLPGRAPAVAGFQLLGIALPWLPLSLTPEASLASLLWLLPAFAALLGVTVLGAFRGRLVAGVLIGVASGGIALGALQLVGGGAAYLYEITSEGLAVGFFANANHNATLLLCTIPFLAALQSALLARSKSPRSASAIRLLVGAAFAVLAVGLLISGSLAGVGIGVPVALATLLVFGRYRPALRQGLVVATALLSIGAVIGIALSPSNNLFGEQKANVELSRQTSFRLTWHAALDYLPTGSGVGSFQPVYRTQEPLATVTTTFMNHAHNDWLEILLEAGVPGLLLLAAFLTWWGLRVRAIWAADEPDRFAQAAAIATAAVMLHSIVDYPLRTAALSVLFATCVGLMSGARPHVRRSRAKSQVRHLTL